MDNTNLDIERIKRIPDLEEEYQKTAYNKSIQEIYEFYERHIEDLDYFLDTCDKIRESQYFKVGLQTIEFLIGNTGEDVKRIIASRKDWEKDWDHDKDFFLGLTNSYRTTLYARLIIVRQYEALCKDIIPDIGATKEDIKNFREQLTGTNGDAGFSAEIENIKQQLNGPGGNDGLSAKITEINIALNGDGRTVGITKKIADLKNESETLMPNVLTIFGVFASFITIVMVLVGTASSWLNASSAAGAAIAFVVPSAIGVLVVCALTAFIRIIVDKKDKGEPGDEQTDNSIAHSLKNWGERWALWLIVLAVCSAFVMLTIRHAEDREKADTLRLSNHTVFVYDIDSCRHEGMLILEDGTEEQIEYIEISYRTDESDQSMTKKFDYDEYRDFTRDGKLYYCVMHECFE